MGNDELQQISEQAPSGTSATLVLMLYRLYLPLSLFSMFLLHIAEAGVVPPPNLPDIFPVLWVVVGCISFLAMWLACLGKLSTFVRKSQPKTNEKED